MKKIRHRPVITAALLCLLAVATPAISADFGFFNSPESFFGFQSSVEVGFFGLFSHKIQFGEATGTYFDYVADGGQDVWFPFRRLSGDILLGDRHRIVFLVQPIDIRTEVLLSSALTVDDETYPSGTTMELRYGFDFYRLSYLYDFFKDPKNELAVGASLQIRDAVIIFAAKADPTLELREERNVGPVPAVKFRAKYYLSDFVWLGTEIDGIYAAGRGVTGSTDVSTDFVGAILDASLRAGFTPRPPVDVFLNLRYLGGGAEGTDTEDPGPGDGYVKNWLHAFSVSLGVTVR